jgi:uncharacterized protein (TIGR02646 family)
MKHITKLPEPQQLIDWRASATEDWEPSYNDLRGPEKQAVKQSLMQEQGYICCYCESRLVDSDSHIEHFQPQSDPSVDPLSYSNLLCSCQRRIEKGDPLHCGNLKNGWYDKQLLISPLEIGCAERFAYSGDGQIRPANLADEPARVTIQKLGLDIPKLNNLRKKAIEPFVDPALSEIEFREFVTGYLGRDTDGRSGEFCTTIRHLFGECASQ